MNWKIQSSRRYDIYKSFRYKNIYRPHQCCEYIRSHHKLSAYFKKGLSNIFTKRCRFLVDESYVGLCTLCIKKQCYNALYITISDYNNLHPFDSLPTEKTFQNVLATEDDRLIQFVSLYISHIQEERINIPITWNSLFNIILLTCYFFWYNNLLQVRTIYSVQFYR